MITDNALKALKGLAKDTKNKAKVDDLLDSVGWLLVDLDSWNVGAAPTIEEAVQLTTTHRDAVVRRFLGDPLPGARWRSFLVVRPRDIIRANHTAQTIDDVHILPMGKRVADAGEIGQTVAEALEGEDAEEVETRLRMLCVAWLASETIRESLKQKDGLWLLEFYGDLCDPDTTPESWRAITRAHRKFAKRFEREAEALYYRPAEASRPAQSPTPAPATPRKLRATVMTVDRHARYMALIGLFDALGLGSNDFRVLLPKLGPVGRSVLNYTSLSGGDAIVQSNVAEQMLCRAAHRPQDFLVFMREYPHREKEIRDAALACGILFHDDPEPETHTYDIQGSVGAIGPGATGSITIINGNVAPGAVIGDGAQGHGSTRYGQKK
jgi:hypothetical protein